MGKVRRGTVLSGEVTDIYELYKEIRVTIIFACLGLSCCDHCCFHHILSNYDSYDNTKILHQFLNKARMSVDKQRKRPGMTLNNTFANPRSFLPQAPTDVQPPPPQRLKSTKNITTS